MNISIYKGKLAQKILILFVAASFFPLLIGSLVSYLHIQSLILNNSQENLRRTSKEYGLSVYSRLKLAKDTLVNNSDYLNTATNQVQVQVQVQANLIHYFSAFAFIDNSGSTNLLWGAIDQSAFDKEHNNGAQIFSIKKDMYKHEIYIIIDNKYLGKINSKYLWHREILDNDIAYCVKSKHHENIFCDSTYIDSDKEGNSKLSASWSLFLDHEFNIDDWIINTIQTRYKAQESLLNFKSFFIPLIVFSLLIVLLFSSVIIRKNLTTINKLIDVTKRFKENNFTAKLELSKNDEFYEVAESFNTMSDHIRETFHQNMLLADIDRTALTSNSNEKLFNTIFNYLFNVCPASEILFIANTNINPNFDSVYYRKKDEKTVSHKDISNPFIFTEGLKKTPHVIERKNFKLNNICKKWKFSNDAIAVLPVSFDNKNWHFILACMESSSESILNSDKIIAFLGKIALSFKALHKDYQLNYKANHDYLTNIANENYVTILHEKQIKKLKDGNLTAAFLFIDLDKFKQVNDNYGHTIGDKLLKAVVIRITRLLTRQECFARLGGDEFLIRLTATNEEVLLSRVNILCEQVSQKVKEPFSINNNILHIGSSIGVSICPKDAIDFEDALRFADIAMYISKKSGGNSYSIYEAEMSEELLKQTLLERDLRLDIENKNIDIYFQPKVNTCDRELLGFEALLRWKNSTYGNISPHIVIGIAERLGLIDVLGNLILELTLQQINHWLKQGYLPGKIAINVSPEQLTTTNFVEFIKDLLEECTYVIPNMVDLEITEDVLLTEKDKSLNILNELRNMGIGIAIDDFGTGYSSLSYLLELPANILKIDRAFVLKIEQDENALSLLSSLINLGKNMGYTIVAEGIETEQQAAFLTECKVDELQGYLFSKPLPAELIEKRFLSITRDNVINYLSN
jgi:diguanylate cyclase (GGDEF)-like protein